MDLTLSSCLWSLRIFPSLPGSRLTIFYRDASSALLQLVNQWLKGYIYSPLLFNIFFAAAIEVVLVRFSEDDIILKDLVHLEGDARVGAGTPLEPARRAVWGMFFADDVDVVSRSQEGLTRMMTISSKCLGHLA